CDYDAHHLSDASGIIEYARVNHLDLTTESSLLFAHYSRFYAARSNIRAFLMNKAFPSYATVLHKISTTGALLESDDHVQAIARQHLRSLNELCRLHGTQCMFVIVPTGQPGENGVAA